MKPRAVVAACMRPHALAAQTAADGPREKAVENCFLLVPSPIGARRVVYKANGFFLKTICIVGGNTI